jgi:hypothetical protein
VGGRGLRQAGFRGLGHAPCGELLYERASLGALFVRRPPEVCLEYAEGPAGRSERLPQGVEYVGMRKPKGG